MSPGENDLEIFSLDFNLDVVLICKEDSSLESFVGTLVDHHIGSAKLSVLLAAILIADDKSFLILGLDILDEIFSCIDNLLAFESVNAISLDRFISHVDEDSFLKEAFDFAMLALN